MLHVSEQDVQAGGVVPATGRFVVNQASGPTPVPPGLAHIPVLPDFSPGPQYADRLRTQQGVPSIERAANGRLWAVWYGGGVSEDMHSYVMLATSGDDGRTWSKGLMIDERGGVSYPDGIEGPPGEIRLIYDYLRTRYGQILMTVVSEREVENGAFASGALRAIVINEVGGHAGRERERHD